MLSRQVGEVLYLSSFVFIYCALKVSEFRRLSLGRASEVPRKNKTLNPKRKSNSILEIIETIYQAPLVKIKTGKKNSIHEVKRFAKA